jgi:FixJ family two-component response regulator
LRSGVSFARTTQRLTARQKQILQLLAEGKSSKELAVAAEYQRENRGDPTAPISCAGSIAIR